MGYNSGGLGRYLAASSSPELTLAICLVLDTSSFYFWPLCFHDFWQSPGSRGQVYVFGWKTDECFPLPGTVLISELGMWSSQGPNANIVI